MHRRASTRDRAQAANPPASCVQSARPGLCSRKPRERAHRAPWRARRAAHALNGGASLTRIAVGDWHPPVAAERAGGDLDPGGRLTALVLGEVDEADYA